MFTKNNKKMLGKDLYHRRIGGRGGGVKKKKYGPGVLNEFIIIISPITSMLKSSFDIPRNLPGMRFRILSRTNPDTLGWLPFPDRLLQNCVSSHSHRSPFDSDDQAAQLAVFWRRSLSEIEGRTACNVKNNREKPNV